MIIIFVYSFSAVADHIKDNDNKDPSEIIIDEFIGQAIPIYLYELASEFHSYWNLGKQQPEKRFINDQKEISPDKLVFLKAISNVIKSGMSIVGVDTPDKM